VWPGSGGPAREAQRQHLRPGPHQDRSARLTSTAPASSRKWKILRAVRPPTDGPATSRMARASAHRGCSVWRVLPVSVQHAISQKTKQQHPTYPGPTAPQTARFCRLGANRPSPSQQSTLIALEHDDAAHSHIAARALARHNSRPGAGAPPVGTSGINSGVSSGTAMVVNTALLVRNGRPVHIAA